MKHWKILIALSFALVGCQAIDAVDATTQMPGKMGAMLAKMDETNAGINKTNDAVHDQAVVLPFEALLDPKYSTKLMPVPTGMMPFGKKLAERAYPDEIIEITYLWLKEIDEVYPEKAVNDKGDELPYTKEQVAQINHEKLARFMALQVIAGFTRQETVEQIVRDQIWSNGRHKKTAYKFLMLRAQFVRDILLDASLLASPLSEVGEIDQAITYASQLDYIAKLPFVDSVAVRTKGFLAPMDNMSELLDKKIAVKKWNKIDSAFDLDLKVGKQVVSGDPQKDEQLYRDSLARAASLRDRVKGYISSWK